jgi:biopolymer transport protein ExbD
MDTRGNDRPARQSLNSEINITPLVDVMLVVLIIFMVVTPLLQQGVNVDLPPARNVADAPRDENRAITVVLQGSGRLFLGVTPIGPEELRAALRERRTADPGLHLHVKADRTLPFGEIKPILQAGRAAGFRGAALVAREIKPGGRFLAGARPVGRGD